VYSTNKNHALLKHWAVQQIMQSAV